MKQIALTVLILAIAASCGISISDEHSGPDDGAWKDPTYIPDSSSVKRQVCHVTGLDYPDGYDWRTDPENSAVKCSLVVFADGRPVMKLPVGEEYHISPDPDMHRVIEGHLYTDYSTDKETIIKKDGQEILRYDGREMILDMKISGENIYTLGRPRKGNGFTFRKNGATMMHRNDGYVFPRLQTMKDTICFAFSTPIESGSGQLERYYHVINGRTEQTAVREDVRKVFDIIWHKGRSCYIASMTGISSPVIVNGEKMKALESAEGVDMLTCRLYSAGKSLFTEAVCFKGGSCCSCLWKDGSVHMLFPEGMTTSGTCTLNEGICCVLNADRQDYGGLIFRCGDTFDIPSGYCATGSDPIAMRNGILHVGLSSMTGGKPMIWKDGNTQTLNINGPLCTLSVD